MIRSFGRAVPRIDKTAFVHDSSEIIGRVMIGPNASIWPMAVIRADVNLVRIGEASNIQDNVVVHCRGPSFPTVIGKGVTVGHGAIIHGARIGDLCLIGMGAIVMEAEIGRECLVAAGAMIPKGLRIPARSLVMGFPAKVTRRLLPQELRSLRLSRDSYVKLAARHREISRAVI